jgi:hypothetical protein
MDAVSRNATMATNDNPLNGAIDFALLGQLAVMCLVVAITAMFIGMLWLFLMRTVPRQLIIITMVLQIILWIVFAVYLFYIGSVIGGIIGLLGAAFTVFVWFMWRDRIPFTAALLSTTANVTKLFPATILVCFIALVVQGLWSSLWGFTAATSSLYATSKGLSILLYIFLIFTFFWTAEVVRNTGHTTVAGLFAVGH